MMLACVRMVYPTIIHAGMARTTTCCLPMHTARSHLSVPELHCNLAPSCAPALNCLPLLPLENLHHEIPLILLGSCWDWCRSPFLSSVDGSGNSHERNRLDCSLHHHPCVQDACT